MKLVNKECNEGEKDMAYAIDLDRLKRDLDELCIDLLSPPEKVTIEVIEERLDIHKKLRSIIDTYLDFKFNN
jgi:hypothetical protein